VVTREQSHFLIRIIILIAQNNLCFLVGEQWKRNMHKCLCLVQGGCEMCIRFNRNFMFYTDRSIYLSFWLSWASALGNFHFTTRCYRDFYFPSPSHFLGFPLYRPPLWDFHLTAHWTNKCDIPTLRPWSKTKLPVQVWQKCYTLRVMF
jgi:hypothetical protein